MEIKPTYTTFEQAKLFKEKGLDVQCNCFYTKPNSKMFGVDEQGRIYPIKNTPKKLYRIGEYATLNTSSVISAPEQWQVIEWLRVNHKLHLLLDYSHDHNKYSCKVFDQFHADELRKRNPRSEGRFPYPYQCNCLRHYYNYNSPQEAYSVAFDYILNNNLI